MIDEQDIHITRRNLNSFIQIEEKLTLRITKQDFQNKKIL